MRKKNKKRFQKKEKKNPVIRESEAADSTGRPLLREAFPQTACYRRSHRMRPPPAAVKPRESDLW